LARRYITGWSCPIIFFLERAGETHIFVLRSFHTLDQSEERTVLVKDYHIITPFLDQTTNTTSYYCTMPISRLKAASLLAPENCQRWGSSFLSYKLPRGISLIQIPSHCAMKNALKIQQISLILTVNHTDNSKWQIENNPEKMLCPKD